MDHDAAVLSRIPERYILGELSPEEREEFELHYFDCAECAGSVRLATRFVANFRAVCRDEAAAAAVKRWTLADWFRWPSLLPSAVAAGFAVLTLYQGAYVIPELRRAAEPQVLASAALRPAARGGEQVIEIAEGSAFFSLVVDVNARERFERYECDLLDRTGARVTMIPAACCESTTLTLLMPADKFAAGMYTLLLHGVNGTQRTEVDRYQFAVKKR